MYTQFERRKLNMKKGCSRLRLSGIILLLAGVACVLPGQATQPTSAISPNTIETAVAGTLQAGATQTAIAQILVVETPPGSKGTVIEQVQDGTTKYTDHDAGFEITFPAGWLAVRPNSDEFNAALANEGASNSMLHDQMTSDMAGYEADYDRLYSYIVRPDIEKNVIFGFSKLAWNPKDATPIDNDAMGRLVRDLETSGAIPGFRANVVQLREDLNVKMVEIGGNWMMRDGQGGSIPFYSTIIFFKPSSDSTARITFTYLQDYKTQISTDVHAVMGSIRLIEP